MYLVISDILEYNINGNIHFMPVKNCIKEFVDTRGKTVYQFWQETGISRTTAYAIYNNPEQYLGKNVVEAICKTYDVQPSELLTYERE